MTEKRDENILLKIIGAQSVLAQKQSLSSLVDAATGLLCELSFIKDACLCLEDIDSSCKGQFGISAEPCSCFQKDCPRSATPGTAYFPLRIKGQPSGHLSLTLSSELVDDEYKYALDKFHETLVHLIAARRGESLLRQELAIQEKWGSLFESLSELVLILITDKNDRLSFVSQNVSQLLGWTPAEALQRETLKDFLGKMPQPLRRIWNAGEAINVEWDVTDKFGEPHQLLVTAKLISFGKQEQVLYFCNDVTDRRNIETELMENLLFLQTLLDAIPSPIYSKDPEGVYKQCNAAFEKLVGTQREKILGRTVFDIYPEGDAKKYHESDIELLSKGKSCEQSHEMKLHVPNDGERDILFKKATYTGASGAVEGLIGVMIDVTDIRSKDQKLRLVTAALQAAAQGVIITDLQGQIIWVNKAFCELNGYREEEVIGQNPRLFKSDYQNKAFYKKMWDTILDGSVWHGEIINQKKDGSLYTGALLITPVRDASGELSNFIAFTEDITERIHLEEERQLIHAAVDSAAEAVITIDMEGHATYTNKAFSEIFGYSCDELKFMDCYQMLFAQVAQAQSDVSCDVQSAYEGEFYISSKDKKDIPVLLRQTAILNKDGQITGVLFIMTDITERKKQREQQEMIEVQLRHAQKLEAIGQLAAGIAHELNTPIQFIGDNLRFIDDMLKDILPLLSVYDETCTPLCAEGRLSAEELERLRQARGSFDLPYCKQEIPLALEQSLEGVKRISDIVRAMKEFSHPGGGEKKAVDINKAITNTVTVARNEWKYMSELKLDLGADIPPAFCYPGELNQVILNILVNAAQAISEQRKNEGTKEKGLIQISTSFDQDWIMIKINDNGPGIPDKIKDRIFDPFFTTKEIGKGTGQGLAISYDVVVNKHQGKLFFDSEEGKGTTFNIWLPRSMGEEGKNG